MNKILYTFLFIIFQVKLLLAAEVFSELGFHFNLTNIVKADLLGKYYDVFNCGGSFGISTPFYFGRFSIHTSVLDNKKWNNNTDHYFSMTSFLEWDYPIEVLKYFRITPGLGAGNYFMYFPLKTEELQIESEICLLGKIGFETNFFKYVGFSCNYYLKEISTFHKLYIEDVEVGFFIKFRTGRRFRNFLK
ncbi:MAG: hypothetical protein JXQ65_09720 [Candidatus Marinimicrobia bacterium]|nr:hypothetical protein [Candidatus Neomarinimicrobiota bacterium]